MGTNYTTKTNLLLTKKTIFASKFISKKPKWVQDLENDAKTDPDIADLIKGTNGDPLVIRNKMRKSLHEKTNLYSWEETNKPSKLKIIFRKLKNFSNLNIMIEFKDDLLERDRDNFEDAIKAFFITGKLGGFNSLNLQVFFSGEIELSFFNYSQNETSKIPAYLHNLGLIEFKGCWARFNLDMGTTDELSIDILTNVLIGFSHEYATILQIVIDENNRELEKSSHQSRLEQLLAIVKKTGALQEQILINSENNPKEVQNNVDKSFIGG